MRGRGFPRTTRNSPTEPPTPPSGGSGVSPAPPIRVEVTHVACGSASCPTHGHPPTEPERANRPGDQPPTELVSEIRGVLRAVITGQMEERIGMATSLILKAVADKDVEIGQFRADLGAARGREYDALRSLAQANAKAAEYCRLYQVTTDELKAIRGELRIEESNVEHVEGERDSARAEVERWKRAWQGADREWAKDRELLLQRVKQLGECIGSSDCPAPIHEDGCFAQTAAAQEAGEPAAPRVWGKHNEEPADRHLILRDYQGDEWGRVREGWMMIKVDGVVPDETANNLGPHPWGTVLIFAPLTEVLSGVPSGGDPEPRCGEDDGDRVPCNAVLDDGFCPDHGEVGPGRPSGGDSQ